MYYHVHHMEHIHHHQILKTWNHQLCVNVQNYQPYIIPYLNLLEASGEFVTDDISFNLTTGDPIEFKT